MPLLTLKVLRPGIWSKASWEVASSVEPLISGELFGDSRIPQHGQDLAERRRWELGPQHKWVLLGEIRKC